MYTYQDFLEAGEDKKMDFVSVLIEAHKHTEEYETAVLAQEYDKKRNRTITNYQKLLYTISGTTVPDNYSANYKICSNFFNRFVTQQSQYLLGNGIDFVEAGIKDSFGFDFDSRLQELGRYALVDGVAFGFWDFDRLRNFRLTEFVPLYDEETGAIMAGVRFWQLDRSKPLRATLYEIDGVTEYMWREGKGEIIKPKTSYIRARNRNDFGDVEILAGENYPTFPIVPLYGNLAKESEIVGIQQQIDAYDLIKSGFCNDLDDASQIYWTIQNAGGMDDVDLVDFVRHMKTVKAAVVSENGAKAESHTIEVPYASREALLERIRTDLYESYMALDVRTISDGAVTATEIRAAYEQTNAKADMFEYCIREFIENLCIVRGLSQQQFSFTRSTIVNAQEDIQNVMLGARYLSSKYVTTKLLTLLGDPDKVEEVLQEMEDEDLNRMPTSLTTPEPEEEEEDNGQGAAANSTEA